MSAAAELAASLRGPSALDLAHGIHEGVPESTYHRRVLGLASKHALDLVAKAPAAYRAWVDGAEDEPTPAMQFGTDFHAALLQPALYKPMASTKPQKDAIERIACMVAAVRAHPVAGPLVRHGKAEVTARSKHPETGLEEKVRADLYAPGLSMLGDVKSCADASPAEFARACANFGYDAQAAMYLDVFQRCGASVDVFSFIAVQKPAPWMLRLPPAVLAKLLVAVYVLDEAALQRGSRYIARHMRTLADCVARDEWAGLADGIQTLSLPKWATYEE